MTLTTEQLRARAKFWREKAVEAKCESVSIAQDMLQNADAFDELAANREAQPVFFIEIEGDDWINAGRIESKNRPDLGLLPDGINLLYDAPPAVPEEMKRDPDADVFDPGFMNGWNACRAAMLAAASEYDIFEDYRAEMLKRVTFGGGGKSSGHANSPAIPDGWKLVPIDATRAMIDAAQRVEEDGYDAMHKAMLAAAPEGGN